LDYRDLHKNAKRIGLNLMQLKAFRDDWGDRMPPDWKHHLRRLDDDGTDGYEFFWMSLKTHEIRQEL
jgi:hypothetical protein